MSDEMDRRDKQCHTVLDQSEVPSRGRLQQPSRGQNAQSVTASEEWTKRAYIPSEDLDALVYLWCKSYAHSPYGVARGAHLDHTPEELAYWDEQEPVVKRLLATADTAVICDPARSRRSDLGPAVIWAFACTSGDVVHYVSVKRKVARILGADLVRDLLGSRLERPCGFTHDLVEMRNGSCGVRLPRQWFSDSTQIARKICGRRAA